MGGCGLAGLLDGHINVGLGRPDSRIDDAGDAISGAGDNQAVPELESAGFGVGLLGHDQADILRTSEIGRSPASLGANR